MLSFITLITVFIAPSAVFGKAVGSAPGFAAGTTGGGNATPQSPSSLAELKTWLSDSTPRVILLEKEYNFIGSAGKETANGCRPASNTCPTTGGQDAINGANWCTNSNYPVTSVTYDKAALTPLEVKSNKSIIGVGSVGVLRGIGLRLSNGVKNVIIQNIHITDLNPKYIWGGDAITLVGTDKIWIDHCKFSLIGRQMLVTGYQAAGHVSITNNEFDGRTSWSASCNGQHYWAMLFLGAADKITLAGNYIHHLSGRTPKVGGSGDVSLHTVNNYFSEMKGHSFDIAAGGKAWIEGNVYENVMTPITPESATHGGIAYNAGGTGCRGFIGRNCVENSLSGSGQFKAYAATGLFSKYSGETVFAAAPVSGVKASVLANAGVGKLKALRRRGRAGRWN